MHETVKPRVITVSATDSFGLSGVQADNRALNALGAHGHNIISAVTAQNNQTVSLVESMSQANFVKQWQSVFADTVKVIKCGLLATTEQIEFIYDNIRDDQLLVWDPVSITTTKHKLTTEQNQAQFQAARRKLVGKCHLITPNQQEAIELLELTIDNAQQNTQDSIHPHSLANGLLALGAHAVVISDGVQSEKTEEAPRRCDDYFACQQPFNDRIASNAFTMSSPCVNTNNTRGTGCQYASLASAALAKDYGVEDAVIIAKAHINSGLKKSFLIGNTSAAPLEKGSLLLNSTFTLSDLPTLSKTTNICNSNHSAQRFLRCTTPSGQEKPIGLYPVVDNAEWVEKLATLGVDTIQLRIKNENNKLIEQEIATAVKFSEKNNVRLFINDHWQLAIKYNAYGVHLGQEDLDSADLALIASAGLRLGLSTHCHYEVCHAITVNPSYIACGPVFATDSKIMPWRTLGIKQLNYWNDMLGDRWPVVAIGGIKLNNMQDVVSSGANGIALISAITQADDPDKVTREMLALIKKNQQANS